MMDKINIIWIILCAILLVLTESCMHGHGYRYKSSPTPCKGNIFIKRIPENGNFFYFNILCNSCLISSECIDPKK